MGWRTPATFDPPLRTPQNPRIAGKGGPPARSPLQEPSLGHLNWASRSRGARGLAWRPPGHPPDAQSEIDALRGPQETLGAAPEAAPAPATSTPILMGDSEVALEFRRLEGAFSSARQTQTTVIADLSALGDSRGVLVQGSGAVHYVCLDGYISIITLYSMNVCRSLAGAVRLASCRVFMLELSGRPRGASLQRPLVCPMSLPREWVV